MHLTPKKEATKPAAKNLLAQQARFDRFIEYYNREGGLDRAPIDE